MSPDGADFAPMHASPYPIKIVKNGISLTQNDSWCIVEACAFATQVRVHVPRHE